MTKRTRRDIASRIEEIEKLEHASDDGGGILILCEHEDGAVTDPSGDPVTESEFENAGIVIEYLSWDVVQTWPDVDDDTEAVQS